MSGTLPDCAHRERRQCRHPEVYPIFKHSCRWHLAYAGINTCPLNQKVRI